ncbi:MAG: hypothetical protein ACF8R7_06010 [Phycisphaerales bacterium JB039]
MLRFTAIAACAAALALAGCEGVQIGTSDPAPRGPTTRAPAPSAPADAPERSDAPGAPDNESGALPAPSPAAAPSGAADSTAILHIGVNIHTEPRLMRQDWGRGVADVVWLTQADLLIEPAHITEARKRDPKARKIGHTVDDIATPAGAREAAEAGIRKSGHLIPEGKVYVQFDNESWAPFMYGQWGQTQNYQELSGPEADRYNQAALRGMIEYTKVWQARFPDARFGWYAIPGQSIFVRSYQNRERIAGVTEKLLPLLRQADVIWMQSYDQIKAKVMDNEEKHYEYHTNNLGRQYELAQRLGKVGIAYTWGLKADEPWRMRAFFRACADLGIDHAAVLYNLDNRDHTQGLIPEAKARGLSESAYWKKYVEDIAVEAGFLPPK